MPGGRQCLPCCRVLLSIWLLLPYPQPCDCYLLLQAQHSELQLCPMGNCLPELEPSQEPSLFWERKAREAQGSRGCRETLSGAGAPETAC